MAVVMTQAASNVAAGPIFPVEVLMKSAPAATLEAAWVMTTAIHHYYEETGRKVGFKPAGGISTTDEALQYLTVVDQVLGEEWMNNKLFRIGASRLANNLLTEIVGEEVKYF